MTRVDRALGLAEDGWYVFPVQPTKAPYKGTHGCWDASVDETVIRQMWTDYPDALVAVHPGMSNKTAIDIDRHPGKPSGFDTAAHLSLVVDAEVEGLSMSGLGKHLWFDGIEPSANDIYPGIDRKSRGGYIVVVYDLPAASDVTEPLPDEYVAALKVASTPRKSKGRERLRTPSADSDASTPMSSKLSSLVYRWTVAEAFVGHDVMLRVQRGVTLMVEDSVAVRRHALDLLRDAWLANPHGDNEDPENEWDTALMGAEWDVEIVSNDHDLALLEAQIDEAQSDPEEEEIRRRVNEMRMQKRARTIFAEEEATHEQLELVSISDLLKRPPIDWLVDRFIQRSTTAILAGAPGTGKSFVAIDAALSIACGLPFLGNRPTRQGKVLYVAGEGGAGMSSRLQAWQEDRGVTVPEGAFSILEKGVDIASESSISKLAKLQASEMFDLIIIDTFSQLARVQSENDAAEVANAIANTQLVRQAYEGSSVLIIHHTGKGQDARLRGSSALQANVDTVWVLKSNAASFVLSTEAEHDGKQKDAPREVIKNLALVPVGKSAVVGEVGIMLPDDNPLSHLDFDVVYSKADVVAALNAKLDKPMAERTAFRSIDNLCDSGKLVRRARGQYERGGIK